MYLSDGTLGSIMKSNDGTVAWAVIATPTNSAASGAVYCAGAGSTWTNSADGNTTTITLNDLSKLPACPSGTTSDTISGCIR